MCSIRNAASRRSREPDAQRVLTVAVMIPVRCEQRRAGRRSPRIGCTRPPPGGTPLGSGTKGHNPEKHRGKYSRNRPLLFRGGTVCLHCDLMLDRSPLRLTRALGFGIRSHASRVGGRGVHVRPGRERRQMLRRRRQRGDASRGEIPRRAVFVGRIWPSPHRRDRPLSHKAVRQCRFASVQMRVSCRIMAR